MRIDIGERPIREIGPFLRIEASRTANVTQRGSGVAIDQLLAEAGELQLDLDRTLHLQAGSTSTVAATPERRRSTGDQTRGLGTGRVRRLPAIVALLAANEQIGQAGRSWRSAGQYSRPK